MNANTISRLYAVALEADHLWSAELKAAFGRNAGDRRYDADQSSHPASCQAAYEGFRTATAAWRRRS